MRRLIAVFLSAVTSVLVSPLLVYLLLCGYSEQWLTGAQLIHQVDQHPFGIFFLVVLVMGFVGRGFYDSAIRSRWVIPVYCSGIGLIAVAGFIIMITSSEQPSPEKSIQEARAAYMRHDLATFKDYVDVNLILSDAVDQLVVSPISGSVGQSDNGFDRLLTAGFAAAAAAGKQVYLPELSRQVEQFVINGSLPNQSESDAFGIALGSNLLRGLAISQLTYGGISETRKLSDDIALVTMQIQSSMSARPLLVTLKLRSSGNHWQIIGIRNLPELAKQLSDAMLAENNGDDHKPQSISTEQATPSPNTQDTPESVIHVHY
jgi:hypothetical protein